MKFSGISYGQVGETIKVEPWVNPDTPGDTSHAVMKAWIESLLGGGGEILWDEGYSFSSSGKNIGWFTKGNLAFDNDPDDDDDVFSSGLVLSNGLVSNIPNRNSNGVESDEIGTGFDQDLLNYYEYYYDEVLLLGDKENDDDISQDSVGDVAFIEFVYQSYGKILTFNYIFASEEYKHISSKTDVDLTESNKDDPPQIIDMFGLLIGKTFGGFNIPNDNKAYFENINDTTFVNTWNINHLEGNYPNLYQSNGEESPTGSGIINEKPIVFDGWTRQNSGGGVRNFRVYETREQKCARHRVKIVIGDFWFLNPDPNGNDGYLLNSAVFLEGGSLKGGRDISGWNAEAKFYKGTQQITDSVLIEKSCTHMEFKINLDYRVGLESKIPFSLQENTNLDYRVSYKDNGVEITDDTIRIAPLELNRTIMIEVLNFNPVTSDTAEDITFKFATSPCDGLTPPIAGTYSGLVEFDVVNNSPITFSENPVILEAQCKETVTLTVDDILGGGVPGYRYNWPNDNTFPPDGSFDYLVEDSPDFVKCIVTDYCNNIDSVEFVINNSPIELKPIGNISFCKPGQSATVEAGWTNNDNPDYGFQDTLTKWYSTNYTPEKPLGEGNPFTINYDNNFVEDTVYIRYEVVDVCGNTAGATFLVDQTGKLEIGKDTTICLGEPITISNNTPVLDNNDNNRTWYRNSVDPANIIINGPVMTDTPTESTLYIFRITDACETIQSDSLFVEVDTFQPSISIEPSFAEICLGDTVTLDASDPNAVSYLWNPGGETSSSIAVSPTEAGNYTYILSASSKHCIDKTASVSFEVIANPVAVFSFDPPDNACTGEEIQFTYQGEEPPVDLYTWNFGDGGSSSVENPNHTYTQDGDFEVSLQVQHRICSAEASQTVTIDRLPTADFSWDLSSGCSPITIQFSDESADAQNATYSWDLGNGSTSNLQNPSATYETPGTYSVSMTVKNTERCFSDVSKNNIIEVYANPQASATADPFLTTMDDPTIDFFDLSESTDPLASYLWDFGDGNSSSESNPTHTYTAPNDEYIVTLQIATINGCPSDTLLKVGVTEDVRLFFPNAFSPNGDGINDRFEIKGTSVTDFHLYIYDRNGAIIWRSHNFELQWDGTTDTDGNPVPAGSYIYVVTGNDYRGMPIDFKGTVSVIR